MMNRFKRVICLALAVVMFASACVFAACKIEHIHKYSSDWSMDEQFHWKAPLCDDTEELAAYGMHNTSGENGACTVCGYKKQTITPPAHACEHVCETCNMCTSTCEDAICADKCQGHTTVHQHALSGWRYNDGTGHYKVCTGKNCTEAAGTRFESGAHNTAGQDGACSICGYKAQTVTPPTPSTHQHTLSGWQKDNTEHYKTCTGENCTEAAGTRFENGAHNTNGTDGACSICGYKAQTVTPPTHVCGHVCDTCGKCTDTSCADAVCGNKCQGHAPAHQHTLSGWKYTDATGHFKTCTDVNCTEPAGTKFEQSAHKTVNGDCVCGYHEHTYATAWSSDENNHWHAATCVHTTATKDFAAHNTANGDCVCGFKATIVDPKIVAYRGYNESLYIAWQENKPSQAKVYYKLVDSNVWTELDAPLIRATEANVARADVIGLTAGKYNIKVTTSADYEIELQTPVTVSAYDRSGYAHFNYTEGVGAYKDNGELKSGALVIYLTEQNKNNVLDYAYLNGVKVDISQYMKGGDGTQYAGIGEMLNNRRYDGNDRANVGIARLCDVYGAVAVRILGKVTADQNADGTSTIVGLTDYSSTGNGGSVGDNGRMARMCNAKNLTIEGIGEDASMFGWGVHFIASAINYKSGAGKSFEVRNITFQNYPEDAIGMEGEQKSESTSSELTYPVERCWVHNNVFFPGYSANPAESDKKEGDGSCDFKRGRYFTLAYNYFEDCHKTNLIGSSKTSLQFCITMHHNWWNNCGSRIPLVRNANVHFYNNYVFGDMSRSPKPDLSYVHSVRANSYVFSEANYYDGCKAVTIIKDEGGKGVVKAYDNQYHSCFNGDESVIVTSRIQAVDNNCKYIYGNVDYSAFDTNPSLFYYDAGKQASDCLLDDAVTARVRVMRNAGVNGFGTTNTDMLNVTPATPVQLNAQGETVIELKSGAAVSNGVVFAASGKYTADNGTLKIKGQGIFFTLERSATLKITTTSTDDNAPDLLRADGTVIAGKFTDTLTVTLEAGTYCITSGQKEKESLITSLSFTVL